MSIQSQQREYTSQRWNLETKAGVASKIVMQVLRNGDVVESRQFSNIMTNYGLQSWASGNLGTHIALGSGSRAEAGNITGLAAYERTQTGSYTYSESNVIDEVAGVMRSNHTLEVVFPIEAANKNYSEMGIHNNSINQLQTYALIRDAIGKPTAQAVLAGEQLRVYYAVQFSLPLSRSAVKDANGVATTITTVPLHTGQSVAARLPQTTNSRIWDAGQPIPNAGLSPTGGTTAPNGTWVGDTYKLSLNNDQGNLAGGISLMRAGNAANQIAIMAHYDPPLNKQSSFSLALSHKIILTNGVFHGS